MSLKFKVARFASNALFKGRVLNGRVWFTEVTCVGVLREGILSPFVFNLKQLF